MLQPLLTGDAARRPRPGLQPSQGNFGPAVDAHAKLAVVEASDRGLDLHESVLRAGAQRIRQFVLISFSGDVRLVAAGVAQLRAALRVGPLFLETVSIAEKAAALFVQLLAKRRKLALTER